MTGGRKSELSFMGSFWEPRWQPQAFRLPLNLPLQAKTLAPSRI